MTASLPNINRSANRLAGHELKSLTEAIATGGLKSSPTLAGPMASAEAALARLQEAGLPREAVKVERIIPRIADGLEELVADLPNAVKRDVDRARVAARRYVGDRILVAEEVMDGEAMVIFRTQKGHVEAAFRRLAGARGALRTSVVAGDRFGVATRWLDVTQCTIGRTK